MIREMHTHKFWYYYIRFIPFHSFPWSLLAAPGYFRAATDPIVSHNGDKNPIKGAVAEKKVYQRFHQDL